MEEITGMSEVGQQLQYISKEADAHVNLWVEEIGALDCIEPSNNQRDKRRQDFLQDLKDLQAKHEAQLKEAN